MRYKSQKLNFNIIFLFFIIGCISLGPKTKKIDNIEIKQSYYSNNKIEYEAKFLNGKLDGLSKTWHENGIISSESYYSNGIPHGIWKKFYSNGSILYEVEYNYGEKNGYEKWFYENGQIKSKQKYINGFKEGVTIRWKNDGSLLY